jgi:hypothetical protein
MTRRLVGFLAIGLLIAAVLLIPSTSTAQWDDYVIVQPSQPTEADEVSIVVGGVWADSCFPEYDDHSIQGNTIVIHAVSGAPPGVAYAPVITPWEFTTHIGCLPAGSVIIHLVCSWGSRLSNWGWGANMFLEYCHDVLAPLACRIHHRSDDGVGAGPGLRAEAPAHLAMDD